MKKWYKNVPWPVCPKCDFEEEPTFSSGFWRIGHHKKGKRTCPGVGTRIIAN